MKSLELLVATGLILFSSSLTIASETVTVAVDNFVRAETDMTLTRYVKQGGFGEFLHIRQPVSIDKQDVIRMNRDTLYSMGVFDLNEPVTIVKPNSDGRYQSMMVINQDHYIVMIKYREGQFTLTKDQVGTRCGRALPVDSRPHGQAIKFRGSLHHCGSSHQTSRRHSTLQRSSSIATFRSH